MNHQQGSTGGSQQQPPESQRKAYLREALKNIKHTPKIVEANSNQPHPPLSDRTEHGRPGPLRVGALQDNKEKGLSAFKALNSTSTTTLGKFQ